MTSKVPGITTGQRPALSRDIGAFGLFSLAFGSMIGVGWVTAMGSWLAGAGPLGAIIAFFVGGGLMLLIGTCYAELTSLLPVAGGEVAYAYKAFGVGKSFLVGWFLSFGYLSVSAFEAISVGKVLAYLIAQVNQMPLYSVAGDVVYAPHLLLALIFTALITWVNYVGVKSATRFQTFLTFAFLACTLLFIIAAFYAGNFENFSPLFSMNAKVGVTSGILSVVVTVPFWFVGFDTIPQSAEEADTSVSYKKLGLLILLSVIGSILFYIVLIFSIALLGNREAIIQADLPTAKAFELALNNPLLVNLILLSALIGLLTSWNGFFLAGSRVLFALGRGKIMTEKMGKSHPKFKTPYVAILFSGIITLTASFLGRGAMLAFVNVGSFCIAAAFLGVSLSFIKLRKILAHKPRPFKLPFGKLIGYISFFGAFGILLIMILPFSKGALAWPLEWGILFSFSALGIVFWFISQKSRNTISKEERDYLILENFAD